MPWHLEMLLVRCAGARDLVCLGGHAVACHGPWTGCLFVVHGQEIWEVLESMQWLAVGLGYSACSPCMSERSGMSVTACMCSRWSCRPWCEGCILRLYLRCRTSRVARFVSESYGNRRALKCQVGLSRMDSMNSATCRDIHGQQWKLVW